MSYKEIKGDLLDLFDQGEFDIIAHGCNCKNIMGAGIAAQIEERYPEVFYADMYYSLKIGTSRLGNGNIVPIKKLNHEKFIANCYTQVNPGANADLTAIRLCLKKLAYAVPTHYKIGLPLIGCGYGGLKFEDVKPIIQEELKDFDVTVVIYEK
jgi:O-acetyl-ADP-ribose deacetylase (regulator of RNase III)